MSFSLQPCMSSALPAGLEVMRTTVSNILSVLQMIHLQCGAYPTACGPMVPSLLKVVTPSRRRNSGMLSQLLFCEYLEPSDSKHLIKWSCSIAIPWGTIREVPVEITAASSFPAKCDVRLYSFFITALSSCCRYQV